MRKLAQYIYHEYRNWRSYKKNHLIYIPMPQQDFVDLATLLTPSDVQGIHKVRIGNPHDGGYIMLDSFNDITAAYSLGISDDVSWDLEIANKGIPVFQYDHTIEALPSHHPLFNFHQLGIGAESNSTKKIDTLQSVIHKNGHSDKGDLLLKIDIEGSEWETFDSLSMDYLKNFRQIVCEFHNFFQANEKEWYTRAKRVLKKLLIHHRVAHVHGNNYAPLLVIGNVPFPKTLEVTFIRADQHTFIESKNLFPIKIDAPNDPQKPDIFLGSFKFQ